MGQGWHRGIFMEVGPNSWTGWEYEVVTSFAAEAEKMGVRVDTTLCVNEEHFGNRITLLVERECMSCGKAGQEIHCSESKIKGCTSKSTCGSCGSFYCPICLAGMFQTHENATKVHHVCPCCNDFTATTTTTCVVCNKDPRRDARAESYVFIPPMAQDFFFPGQCYACSGWIGRCCYSRGRFRCDNCWNCACTACVTAVNWEQLTNCWNENKCTYKSPNKRFLERLHQYYENRWNDAHVGDVLSVWRRLEAGASEEPGDSRVFQDLAAILATVRICGTCGQQWLCGVCENAANDNAQICEECKRPVLCYEPGDEDMMDVMFDGCDSSVEDDEEKDGDLDNDEEDGDSDDEEEDGDLDDDEEDGDSDEWEGDSESDFEAETRT
ncbi:hypothetical protein BDD12DRAFT_173322 [Trichophaea hybrida]|nr:hypothetical protein BDD12DRAFT_173322 [Trichophaea hybrida]